MAKDEVFFSLYSLVDLRKGILIATPSDNEESVNLYLPNITKLISKELSDFGIGKRGELKHKDPSQKKTYVLKATFELIPMK